MNLFRQRMRTKLYFYTTKFDFLRHWLKTAMNRHILKLIKRCLCFQIWLPLLVTIGCYFWMFLEILEAFLKQPDFLQTYTNLRVCWSHWTCTSLVHCQETDWHIFRHQTGLSDQNLGRISIRTKDDWSFRSTGSSLRFHLNWVWQPRVWF